MDAEQARRILALSFPEATHERYLALSYAAQEGVLSPDEVAELQSLLNAETLLIELKSRARQTLRDDDRAGSAEEP